MLTSVTFNPVVPSIRLMMFSRIALAMFGIDSPYDDGQVHCGLRLADLDGHALSAFVAQSHPRGQRADRTRSAATERVDARDLACGYTRDLRDDVVGDRRAAFVRLQIARRVLESDCGLAGCGVLAVVLRHGGRVGHLVSCRRLGSLTPGVVRPHWLAGSETGPGAIRLQQLARNSSLDARYAEGVSEGFFPDAGVADVA